MFRLTMVFTLLLSISNLVAAQARSQPVGLQGQITPSSKGPNQKYCYANFENVNVTQ